MKANSHKLLGGILLVSGTTIGAGMLALPVISGFAGFIPSILLLIVFWAYMTYTALLILEVNLSSEKDSNLISMAKATLGRPGEWIVWVAYLFLLYSLTTAYLAGGGPIVVEFIESITGTPVKPSFGVIPLFMIFGFFVFRGTRSVDYLNRILMIALAISYLILVVYLTPHVSFTLLSYMDPKYLLTAISVVATSFGFHIIIPSLTNYLDRDVAQLKKAIWIGGLIPLVIYIVWEFLTLGIIPVTGVNSIRAGYATGVDGAHLLSKTLGNSHIALLARFFSFFAIVTSFLGVSLSLFDCLSSSLKISKKQAGRYAIFGLTFIPPLSFALSDPRAFLTALQYAGAFGVVILLGLMPALMAWSKRYYQHSFSIYTVKGGKICLLIVIVFSLFIITLELMNQFGMINL